MRFFLVAVALLASGCKYERGAANITPLHAETRVPLAMQSGKRLAEAQQALRQISAAALPADSAVRYVLDEVKDGWLDRNYVIQQEFRVTDAAIVRQVFNSPHHHKLVRNLECTHQLSREWYRVARGQLVSDVPNVEGQVLKWIQVELAFTTPNEVAPTNVLHELREELYTFEDHAFECVDGKTLITPPLNDDGHGPDPVVRAWIRELLGRSGKLIGARVTEITGTWDDEDQDWKIRYSPVYIVS